MIQDSEETDRQQGLSHSLNFPTTSQDAQWQGSARLHHHSVEGLDGGFARPGISQQERRSSSDRYSNVRPRKALRKEHSDQAHGTQHWNGADFSDSQSSAAGSSRSSVNFVRHEGSSHDGGELENNEEEDGGMSSIEGQDETTSGEFPPPTGGSSRNSVQDVIEHSISRLALPGPATGQGPEGSSHHSGGSSNLLPIPDFDSRSPEPLGRVLHPESSCEDVSGGVGTQEVLVRPAGFAFQLRNGAAEADRMMVGAMRQSAGVLVQSSTAALQELEGMMDRLTLLREQLIASRQQQVHQE